MKKFRNSTTGDWGGGWTVEKLARLRAYLQAYAIALKNQKFDRIYIDAFAGTGYRNQAALRDNQSSLFEDFQESDRLMKGSARIALEIEPRFNRYIFIEKDRRKFESLSESIESDYPDRIKDVEFLNEDANSAIPRLCKTIDWSWRNRAVVFLDPFGMQVDWTTIEEIARSQAIDMWYLFPAFIGRLLKHSGAIPEEWALRLDLCLGARDWREEFYPTSTIPDLFTASREVHEREFDEAKVEQYFTRRLHSIFAAVGKRALPLKNSRNALMYLLFFACNGNEKARTLALKLANNILKK